MKLTLLILLSTLILAQEVQAPGPILLNQQEQQSFQEIQRTFQILNLQLEMLRHDVCWRNGVKIEECGQWDGKGGITRIPLNISTGTNPVEPVNSKKTNEK